MGIALWKRGYSTCVAGTNNTVVFDEITNAVFPLMGLRERRIILRVLSKSKKNKKSEKSVIMYNWDSCFLLQSKKFKTCKVLQVCSRKKFWKDFAFRELYNFICLHILIEMVKNLNVRMTDLFPFFDPSLITIKRENMAILVEWTVQLKLNDLKGRMTFT